MTAPRLSIVLSTRDRAAFLPDALRALERIESPAPWELIVVDNGSTDATPDVLRAFAASTRVAFRAVHEPRPGLSRARNAGWRAATADVIAFTDDDCYPAPDFVDAWLACFTDPAVGYAGGRITLHDPADAPVTIQLLDTPVEFVPRTFARAGVIQGANMAARRTVLDALGGFDERLGAGTPFPSEDLDFVSRAAAAGWAGRYDPRPSVAHHHRRRTPEQVEALRRGYDLGRGAYYAKCLLDPLRRAAAARVWTRSLARTLAAAPGSARARAQFAGELRGALGWLAGR